MVIRDGSLLLWLVSFVQILKTKSHAFNQFSRYNFNIYLPVWPHFICTGKSITYLTNHFTSLFCWLFRTFCLPLTLKYTGHSFNIFRGAVGQVVCHLITSTGMNLQESVTSPANQVTNLNQFPISFIQSRFIVHQQENGRDRSLLQSSPGMAMIMN